jgi:hypothetical protein
MVKLVSPYGHIALRTGPAYRDIRKVRHTAITSTVSERQWQDHVCTVAALYGWHGIHFINSRGNVEGIHSPNRRFPRGADHDDARGFPDLVLVHPGRNLGAFVELKARRGRVAVEQHRWLGWWHDLGTVRSFLWRPEDEQEMCRTLRDGW